MTVLLEARGVGKIFTGGGFVKKTQTVALEEASLFINDDNPTITAIAGESGSGKTTLARLILGIIQPSGGQMFYKGRDVEKMSGEERRVFRREVQAIFQDPFEVYNPFYKAEHTLTLSIEKFGLAKSKAEAQEKMEQALQTVGLRPEETLGRYPHQLSGGQRQRVMVARSFLLKPRIIVADEPVSMVDASLRATILESLLKLNTDLGVSLVYITHDLTTAYQVSSNILMLYQGAVVEQGDPELVIKQPRHPYTQLLVGSIPLPDPKLRKQRERLRVTLDEVSGSAGQGCRFALRCPYATAACRKAPPPLFLTEPRRAVACYLAKDSPTTTSAEMARAFA